MASGRSVTNWSRSRACRPLRLAVAGHAVDEVRHLALVGLPEAVQEPAHVVVPDALGGQAADRRLPLVADSDLAPLTHPLHAHLAAVRGAPAVGDEGQR